MIDVTTFFAKSLPPPATHKCFQEAAVRTRLLISDIVGGVSNTISIGSSGPSSRPSCLELQASNKNETAALLQSAHPLGSVLLKGRQILGKMK
jgi:hypothetical protein